MAFPLLLIGLLLVVVGLQDTHKEFGAQLTKDFTGPNNFMYWIVALGSVGALGYFKPLEKFSRMFLALIIIAIVVGKNNKDFFNLFTQGIQRASNPVSNVVNSSQ